MPKHLTSANNLSDLANKADAREALLSLVDIGDPSISAGWTDEGGGVYAANVPSGSYSGLSYNAGSMVGGGLYLLTLRCVAYTSGGIQVYFGVSGSGPAYVGVMPLAVGNFTGLLGVKNGGQENIVIVRANNGFVGTISDVRLRRIA